MTATELITATIKCNGAGERCSHRYRGRLGQSASELRRDLAKAGWVSQVQGALTADFCPTHRSEIAGAA